MISIMFMLVRHLWCCCFRCTGNPLKGEVSLHHYYDVIDLKILKNIYQKSIVYKEPKKCLVEFIPLFDRVPAPNLCNEPHRNEKSA